MCVFGTVVEFQALIGTAKTRATAARADWRTWFRALIGTAKTKMMKLMSSLFDTFRALIGTAKTLCGGHGVLKAKRFEPS